MHKLLCNKLNEIKINELLEQIKSSTKNKSLEILKIETNGRKSTKCLNYKIQLLLRCF